MNRLIILVISLFSFTLAHSQGVKPQNVYRVTVTSRYVLENGERTSQFFAVNQEISDSLGRLHTEIDYNWETRHPDNYRWHFFDSMVHVRTDFFVKEQIDRRVVYEYNGKGAVVREFHFQFQDGDSSLFKTISYSYNSDGLPTQTEAVNENGRRLYRARSTFDSRGTEIKRRVSGRRGEPADKIKRLDRTVEYDSLGQMVTETSQIRMSDGSRPTYSKKYMYDPEGNVAEIIELDANGRQVSRTEYVWQPNRDRISRIIYYDGNDQLEKYLAKRYEIYRTNDRRQRVIDY
ncbi:MAG: hypothetical protein ACFCUM_12135 [Bacteroidales bacterium]